MMRLNPSDRAFYLALPPALAVLAGTMLVLGAPSGLGNPVPFFLVTVLSGVGFVVLGIVMLARPVQVFNSRKAELGLGVLYGLLGLLGLLVALGIFGLMTDCVSCL